MTLKQEDEKTSYKLVEVEKVFVNNDEYSSNICHFQNVNTGEIMQVLLTYDGHVSILEDCH